MAGDIHVGDEGIDFEVEFLQSNGAVLDISTQTTLQIIFDRPQGAAQLVEDADFLTDGLDGVAVYTATTGDLSGAGVWAIQGYVEIPGYKGHTAIGSFTVKSNLN